MVTLDTVRDDLREGRERFLALVADLRPELHRYCTRMTGSVSAGEDVVQDTLAKAYYSLGEVHQLPQLRAWLFQIAHSRAIDYLRRYDRRKGQPLEPVARTPSPARARYAELFNARDWNAVREMLADDVRLDLVSRQSRTGKRDVSGYVSNYAANASWRLAPAWLDGREVLAGFRELHDARPSYFIELTIENGLVTRIRDFRYVPYIALDAAIQLAS